MSSLGMYINAQTFQPLILIYRRGNFVCHDWGCTSIFRPLSYPFKSLVYPLYPWQTLWHKISKNVVGIPPYIPGKEKHILSFESCIVCVKKYMFCFKIKGKGGRRYQQNLRKLVQIINPYHFYKMQIDKIQGISVFINLFESTTKTISYCPITVNFSLV